MLTINAKQSLIRLGWRCTNYRFHTVYELNVSSAAASAAASAAVNAASSPAVNMNKQRTLGFMFILLSACVNSKTNVHFRFCALLRIRAGLHFED